MEANSNRPFMCDSCSLRFTSKHFLERHSAVHTEDRNFTCRLCLKSYKYKKGLNRHYKKVHHQSPQQNLARIEGRNDEKKEKEKGSSKYRKNTSGSKDQIHKRKKMMSGEHISITLPDEKSFENILIKNESKIFITSPFPMDN